MPHKTRPKLDWRAVDVADKAADAEDVSWDGRELWDVGKKIDPDSMVGFLVEKLLGEYSKAPTPPLAPAIEILKQATREYRAWKLSKLPSPAQVREYLIECEKRARNLADFMQHMDPRSRRMIANVAREDSPTAFDPRPRPQPHRPRPRKRLPRIQDQGDARVSQAHVIVRRFSAWCTEAADTARESNSRDRSADGKRHLVESAIQVWEMYDGDRAVHLSEPLKDFVVRFCVRVDDTLDKEDSLARLAKDYLADRKTSSPK